MIHYQPFGLSDKGDLRHWKRGNLPNPKYGIEKHIKFVFANATSKQAFSKTDHRLIGGRHVRPIIRFPASEGVSSIDFQVHLTNNP